MGNPNEAAKIGRMFSDFGGFTSWAMTHRRLQINSDHLVIFNVHQNLTMALLLFTSI